MLAEEVNRYKNEMLDYFHARPIDTNNTDFPPSSPSHQYYTTSLTQTTYELEGYNNNESNFIRQVSVGNSDQESSSSPPMRSSPDDHVRLKNVLNEQEQLQIPTFLTEDSTPTNETNAIPFHEAFRIPSNLINSLMFKYD
jgi:hypothetical protein